MSILSNVNLVSEKVKEVFLGNHSGSWKIAGGPESSGSHGIPVSESMQKIDRYIIFIRYSFIRSVMMKYDLDYDNCPSV